MITGEFLRCEVTRGTSMCWYGVSAEVQGTAQGTSRRQGTAQGTNWKSGYPNDSLTPRWDELMCHLGCKILWAQGTTTGRAATYAGTEVSRPRRKNDVQNGNNSRGSVACVAKRYRVEPGVIWLKATILSVLLFGLVPTISLFTEHTYVRSQWLYHWITGITDIFTNDNN